MLKLRLGTSSTCVLRSFAVQSVFGGPLMERAGKEAVAAHGDSSVAGPTQQAPYTTKPGTCFEESGIGFILDFRAPC